MVSTKSGQGSQAGTSTSKTINKKIVTTHRKQNDDDTSTKGGGKFIKRSENWHLVYSWTGIIRRWMAVHSTPQQKLTNSLTVIMYVNKCSECGCIKVLAQVIAKVDNKSKKKHT